MLQSCQFVTTACRGLLRLVCKEFTACRGSFLSCNVENDPDPKSVRYLVPDKPVSAMACRGYVTDPAFLCAFL